MNITEMTDQEKSVMLARLCGWLKTDDAFYSYFPPNGRGMSVNHQKGYTPEYIFTTDNHIRDLYHSANMAQAWRVLNWAETRPEIKEHWIAHAGYWWFYDNLFQKPPEEAQRLWLDKILELAIDAGMVTA